VKIGILTRNQDAWCSSRLVKAFRKRGVQVAALDFTDLAARINITPEVSIEKLDLMKDLNALLVRPIGRGSLDEVIFQMDVLHKLSRMKLPVINTPSAIEKAVDKYYTLTLLGERGIPVPRTLVTENVAEALRAFKAFGGDAVVKPIFGSRGIGAARISDVDIAERIFRTLRFNRHVIYVQEFIQHQGRDIRTLIVGEHVVASMYRISHSWKTNVSLGAKSVHAKPVKEIEKIALDAANSIGCDIAGVDIMESPAGPLVSEVNSQPGWKGLQSTTRRNIADRIAEFVISKARK
jgi:RimK family alpha-L-glutamate ligase